MWHSSILAGAASCDCYLCRPRIPLSAYLPRPASRAPPESAYYLVAVSGGTVLSKGKDGVSSRDAVNSNAQRWRVEYGDGEGEGLVALMNVSDGKWLRASSGDAYGFVDTSDEKQWWVLEEGVSPGSCWLRCKDFEDAYLCNANGSFVDGNAIYTRPKQSDRAYAFTWNLRDADAVGYDSKGWKVIRSLEDGAEDAELSERERFVIREEEQLATREAALKKQAEELAYRETELKRLSNDSNSVALLKAENDNLHLQLRTSSLEREVEKVRQRSVSVSTTEQLRNLEVEKARLRVRLHAEQQKVRSSPSPSKLGDSSPVFSSPSSLATRPMSKTSTSPGKSFRPGSLSESKAKPFGLGLTVPSPSTNPGSAVRRSDGASSYTPTNLSTGVLSSAPSTQRSSDSRFSGWTEDDVYSPATPSRSPKQPISSKIMTTTPSPIPNHARLSKENLASTNQHSFGKAPSHASGIPSVSSTCGKATSKSTPARPKPPRMGSLNYGAPGGMLPLKDDGDSILYPCGHKVYKPPRKLNKTVVGYMYE